MGENGGFWSKIAFWAVTTVFGVVCLVAIPTLASNIINNDKASRARDIEINEHSHKRHESHGKEISAIQADVREIKTAQVYMQRDLDEMRMEQKTAFTELKEILKNGS